MMNKIVRRQQWLFTQVLCLMIGGSFSASSADSAAVASPVAVSTPASYHGAIGLGSWNTAVEFTDIVVTGADGGELYRSDFANTGTNGLSILRGTWSVKDGVLRQSAIEPQCRAFLGDRNWTNYTINLRARSLGGQEGFAVYFNARDGGSWTWFNFAGWTNTLASIDQQNNGGAWRQLCERVPATIQSNVWYDIRVVLNGARIECYVNSKLVQSAAYSTPTSETIVAETLPQNAPDQQPSLLNPTFRGAVGVGTWGTSVEFRNIVVTSNGVVLYRSNFEEESLDAWQIVGGNWIITNGVLRQTGYDLGCFAQIGDTNWSNYTLTLQARKLSGAEGLIAVVGAFGDNNRVWFNVGSWGNRWCEIFQDSNGRRGALTGLNPAVVETGKWYDLRVVVDGAQVSGYLDSNLIHTAVANVLVTTNAVYLGATPTPEGHLLKFRTGNREFLGNLPKDRGGPPALEIGSVVRVTGSVRPGIDVEADMELFSAADVELLQLPSWWTWRRILWFAGAALGVLTIAAMWIAMISRKNRLLTIAQGELQKANDELEQRVQERTTDLANANSVLQHEQALFRALLDNASDYIYFKDPDSRFVRCSISLCHMAGLSHEQMVGKTDFDILSGVRAQLAFDDEREIMQTGQPLMGKLEQNVNADGRASWVLTTKMPWRSPEGKIIGTFGISRDITAIKEAEAKLEQAQKQVIEASRAAGMAEVATGVLHNIGNVLNSVNVSTNLLVEQLRKSKVKSVGRVATLMKDHAADLGDFMTKDPHGQQVAPFLWELSEQLGREQAQALEELVGLQAHVDHIKVIVAQQQDYATVSGVISNVRIPELVEDALRLTESSLERHGVKVVKEFDPHPPDISVDRHKVLQILVNLVRNAKQACQDAQRSDKQLTLRATVSEGSLRISVADNGVGIPPAHLTRIFAHGYTTRKNGHGFGLHSSALAAQELGGQLLAQSDGPGQGATFTLELRLDPKAAGVQPVRAGVSSKRAPLPEATSSFADITS